MDVWRRMLSRARLRSGWVRALQILTLLLVSAVCVVYWHLTERRSYGLTLHGKVDRTWSVGGGLKQSVAQACRVLDEVRDRSMSLPAWNVRLGKSNYSVNSLEELVSLPQSWQFTVNDEYRIIHCRVAKTATKEWRKIFGILQHQLANVSLSEVPQPPSFGELLILKDYRPVEAVERLSSYFTMTIVRHPFQRLMSAYLDKFKDEQAEHQRRYGRDIVLHYRNSTQSSSVVTFTEFTQWLVDAHPPRPLRHAQDDIHWLPMVRLCLPCVVDYTFIGRFEYLAEDATRVFDQIGVASWLKYPEYPSKTSDAAEKLWSSVSRDVVEKLLERYMLDFIVFGYDPVDTFSFDKSLSDFVRKTFNSLSDRFK